MNISKIYLGLGTNVGDRKKNLKHAIRLLKERISKIELSSVYESKAVGYTNQDDFLNMVLSGETNLTSDELLTFVKDIEKSVGRIYRFRWGPREIDIDILFYNDNILNSENLVIPHPRLHEREFVLLPLTEIKPDHIHPVLKKTIEEIHKGLENKDKSVLKKLTKLSLEE